MILSFFPYLNLVFSPFTMPLRHSSQRGSYLYHTESISNGAIQVSRHEEITIDPSNEPLPSDRCNGGEASFRVPIRSNLHVLDAWLSPQSHREDAWHIASYSVEHRTKYDDVWIYAEALENVGRRWHWRTRMPCFNTSHFRLGIKRSWYTGLNKKETWKLAVPLDLGR